MANNPYNYMEQYLKQNHNNSSPLNNISNNSNVILNSDNKFESNDIINILLNKFEQEKINQSKPYGRYDRYISVTDSYNCPRQLWFRRMKYEPDINKIKKYPHTVLMNKVGEFVHNYMADQLGIYQTTNMYLSIDQYKIRGKCDGIFEDKLIEIKTVFPMPDNYTNQHILQLLILAYLGIKNGYKINTIYLIYICRNFKEFKEWKFEINNFDELEKFILKYMEYALLEYTYIKNKEMPNEIVLDDCFFCYFEKHCDKKGKNISFFNFDSEDILNKITNNINNNQEIINSDNKINNDIIDDNDKEVNDMVDILFEDVKDDNNENMIEQKNNEQNKNTNSLILNDIEWL